MAVLPSGKRTHPCLLDCSRWHAESQARTMGQDFHTWLGATMGYGGRMPQSWKSNWTGSTMKRSICNNLWGWCTRGSRRREDLQASTTGSSRRSTELWNHSIWISLCWNHPDTATEDCNTAWRPIAVRCPSQLPSTCALPLTLESFSIFVSFLRMGNTWNQMVVPIWWTEPTDNL